jgi:tetratricopeptide (TPR) repeat protein
VPLTDSYEAIYEKAVDLASQGRWDDALVEYRRILDRLSRLSRSALRSRPDLVDLVSHVAAEMSDLMVDLERPDEAIELLCRMADVFPDDEAIWLTQAARCRIEKGDAEQALAELQALAQNDPVHSITALGMGEAYMALESYEEALANFDRSIQLATQPAAKADGYLAMVYAYMALGQPDQVARAWDAAVALDPTIADGISSIYEYYLGMFEPETARLFIEREPNPLKRGLYSGIADELEGHPDSARKQWRRVFHEDITAETEGIESWMEAGLSLGASGKVVDTVTPLLGQGAHLDVDAVILLAVAWAMEGDVEAADKFLETLRLDPRLTDKEGKLLNRYYDAIEGFVTDEAVKEALWHHFEDDEPA